MNRTINTSERKLPIGTAMAATKGLEIGPVRYTLFAEIGKDFGDFDGAQIRRCCCAISQSCVQLPRSICIRQSFHFEGQQMVNLTAVSGFHVMVSAMITAGRVGFPNGGPAPMRVLVK